ncbi:hypothetical protein N7468_003487 [Penicillium chermesinum]|uniref:Uncharacterized protein n=1 Tax=Penicillium chermesinum TaxID=63820 RepID=A0A9W9TSA8_9EURO|nr:uncharacterized protein N7468_003487 [Penicillium chermesinum]KAJ5238868.1 hypothetical protein N7468_003487 [Penicillium chermesinum]
MPQLFPANPSASMVIRNVTPNIITMSLPFARFGIVRFGARGTLVKLATGSLAIFSPVSMTPEVREVVQAQGGNVKYIIAPDMEHHLHITAWKNAFPEAAILAPEGLWEKRQKNSEYNDAPFQYVFKKEGSPPTISEEFDAEFDIEYVHAHGNREIVALHRPSRTLIEADLLFNLPATEQYSKTKDGSTANFLTRLFLPAMSVGNPPTGQRRFIWYLATTDRGAFQQSIRRIIRWDFDRLIPCHGDVIETGAKEVFQNVFAWFLQEDHEHV